MKPVLVTVQSIQRDEDGQELKLELVSAGKYYCKQNVQYIVYEESEITGMVCRLSVPSGIEIPADKCTSVVPWISQGGAG